jgi:adducin
MGYAKGEKILRCKLASAYRLMDLYGWTQGVYNQISVSGQQSEMDVI